MSSFFFIRENYLEETLKTLICHSNDYILKLYKIYLNASPLNNVFSKLSKLPELRFKFIKSN